MIELLSFSYRDTGPPPKVDRVFDCRPLKNPYTVTALRKLTGRDDPVQAYLRADTRFQRMLDHALEEIEQGNHKIAFGCLGGKHRSVGMAEILAEKLHARHPTYAILIHHPVLDDMRVLP